MSLVNKNVTLNGVTTPITGGSDGTNFAHASVLVDSGLAEKGVAANPLFVAGGANVVTNQVSVGTTATLICAARAGRQAITIIQEGTTLVRMGASGVTLTTGVPLPGTAYEQFTFPGGAAIYGIVASGTQTVSYVETY